MAKLSKKSRIVIIVAAVVAAVAICVALLFAFGVFNRNDKNFLYRKVAGGYEIVSCNKDSATIVIPSRYKGQNVVGIADGAFYSETKFKDVKQVLLPSTLEYIGKNAFAGLWSVEKIVIPKNTKSIGEGAFMNCALLDKLEFEEGSSLVHFGKNALFGTPFVKNFSGEGALVVGNVLVLARNTNNNFVIDKNIQVIAQEAFLNNVFLLGVSCEDESNLLSVCENAFSNCQNLENADFLNAKSLETVENCAFWACSALEGVTFADGLSQVGGEAFANCSSLAVADLGKGDIVFGDAVFGGCVSLSKIRLSASSKNIDGATNSNWQNILDLELAVSSGKLDENFARQVGDKTQILVIETDASIEREGLSAFSKLDKLTIPAKVLSRFDDISTIAVGRTYDLIILGDGTEEDRLDFVGTMALACARSVKLVGVTSICDKAFFNCANISEVEFDDAVLDCGYSAFAGTHWLTNLKTRTSSSNFCITCGNMLVLAKSKVGQNQTVEVPEGITKIDNDSLYASKVVLPTTLQEIGASALGHSVNSLGVCFLLDETGVSHIKTIGDEAFLMVTSLSVSTKNKLGDGSFEDLGSSLILDEIESVGKNIVPVLPENGIVTFGTTVLVGAGQNIAASGVLQIPAGVRVIADAAFSTENENVVKIVFSSSVEKVGQRAFVGFENLREIDFSAAVEFVSNGSFGLVENGRIVVRGNTVLNILDIFGGFSGELFVAAGLADEYASQNLENVSLVEFEIGGGN